MTAALVQAATASVLRRLRTAFPPHAYSITALENPALPSPVRQFLVQMLQQRLNAEVASLASARSLWFDYEVQEVVEAQEGLTRTLARHARFPKEEWDASLEFAVRTVVPYLIQPVAEFPRWVFQEGQAELPVERVWARMDFLTSYRHLNDVVRAYVEQKNLTSLSRDHFAQLLRRIELRTPHEYSPQAWMRLMRPFFETFGENGLVSAELLAVSFADRGMHHVELRLNRFPQGIALHDIEALVASAPDPAPTPFAPTPSPAPPSTPAPTPVATPDPPQVPSRREPLQAAPEVRPTPLQPVAAGDEKVPLWMKFQKQTPPHVATSAAPPPKEEKKPLWARFQREQPVAKAAAPTPTPPTEEPDQLDRLERRVMGSINPDDRRRFIRVLFSNSVEAYQRTLLKMSEARTWSEASRALAEAFRHHYVNIYSEDAVDFTDRAESRFT